VKWPWYLLLVGVFPILSLYAHNIDEVSLADLLLPLGIAIVAITLIALPLMFILKQYNKTALILAYFVVLFYSYGHIRNGIVELNVFPMYHIDTGLVLAWLAIAVVVTVCILRLRGNLQVVTTALNITMLVAVLVVGGSIGFSSLSIATAWSDKAADDMQLDTSEPSDPDIYYIVLDMYSRDDAILEMCDYDNSAFTDGLRDRGFHVLDEALVNYGATHISMASSLNMRYLNPDERHNMPILYEMIRYNSVARLLKDRGYDYAFVTGSWGIQGMQHHTTLDVHRDVHDMWFSKFADTLRASSILVLFTDAIYKHPTDTVAEGVVTLKEMPKLEQPVFTYAHFLCPHAPFLPEGAQWPEGYVNNLKFLNSEVLGVVDAILADSEIPPVIILQGDHGVVKDYYDHPRRVFQVLNAYYLPDGDYGGLYGTITPVNTFRVVFNHCFGTDFEILEDTGDEWLE